MPVTISNYGLTFDDVLIKPLGSRVYSRKDVNTDSYLLPSMTMSVPIISANMDTVTELQMANTMCDLGGLGVIHRFLPFKQQLEMLKETNGWKVLAVGVIPETLANIKQYVKEIGPNEDPIVLIDVAHGHSDRVVSLIQEIKATYNFARVNIIAGNVATYDGALALLNAGADAIKVGVGPGSVCSTRIVTGCGVPQLTAIMEVRRAIDKYSDNLPYTRKPTLIADGGIKTSGDIVKALAAGANTVMLGGLLAGTSEAPGDVVTLGDKRYKGYRGMASNGAQSTIGVKRTPEGVEALVPFKGSVVPIVNDLVQGVRSGLSYLNSFTIKALHERDIEFIQISHAGRAESVPHITEIAVTL